MKNFKKVVFVASLGTVMALGSMSSAFAADLNHTVVPAKKVVQQQQQQQQQQHVKLLTESQAKAIALKQYKGNVRGIQLTKENGKNVYVIVIHGKDGKDHTVKVDAITGAVTIVNLVQQHLTQEQAKAFALKQYKGTVKDIHLNKENGKDVYVAVIHGQDGKDHNVKIDASTGENIQ